MLPTIVELPEELYQPWALSSDQLVGLLGWRPSGRVGCMGIDGQVLWTTELENPCTLGDVRDGRVWLYEERAVVALNKDGVQTLRQELSLEKDEKIGWLTAHDQGVLVSLYRQREHARHGLAPRVIKLDLDGRLVWSTKLPVNAIAYQGCVRMRASTNWKMEEMPPWKPSTWLPYGYDQLLVTQQRVLATFKEMPRTGIGCRYVLDANNGDLIWKSKPSPTAHALALESEKFLMGDQGYGAFRTTLYEEGMAEFKNWPSHGHEIIVDGELISVQMGNDSSFPQHVARLRADGQVEHLSERLPGYYTSKPVLVNDNQILFWRAGKIWKWSQAEGLKNVAELSLDEGAYATSLPLSENRIAFNVCPGYGRDRSHRRMFAVLEF